MKKHARALMISAGVSVLLAGIVFARYALLAQSGHPCSGAFIVFDFIFFGLAGVLFAALWVGFQKKSKDIDRLQHDIQQKTSDVLLATERERRKIALALHDRIGQNLALTRKKLDRLAGQPDDTGDDPIAPILGLVDQTISDMRSLNFEISPHILYDEGLEGALDWLCEQTEKDSGIRVIFYDDLKPKPLSEDSRILLYRCSRELLMNAVNHGNASVAQIRVGREGDILRIEVEDNGVGFKTDRNIGTGRGFGLSSVRGQVRHKGGDIMIRSGVGKGTVVVIVYPLVP